MLLALTSGGVQFLLIDLASTELSAIASGPKGECHGKNSEPNPDREKASSTSGRSDVGWENLHRTVSSVSVRPFQGEGDLVRRQMRGEINQEATHRERRCS